MYIDRSYLPFVDLKKRMYFILCVSVENYYIFILFLSYLDFHVKAGKILGSQKSLTIT